MDNRETDGDNSNDTPHANVQLRPPRPWANAHQRPSRAANNRGARHPGPLRLNNASDLRQANSYPDNRDAHFESLARNNAAPSSNISTVVNDLSNPSRSNESAHNHTSHSHPNNNNTVSADSSPVNDSANDASSRPVNLTNHTRLRRRNSNNTRGGGSTRSNTTSMNPRAFNQSTSPIRINNSRQRVPPLRLRGNSSPSRNPEDYSRPSLSPGSPEMEAVFPSRYLRLASLDDQHSLSPPNVLEEPSTELTDEQIARQLQQEEWERSSTPGDFSFVPSHPRRFLFDRPPRRNHGGAPRRPGLSVQLSPLEPEPSGASANPFPVRGLRSMRFGDRMPLRNQSQAAAAELLRKCGLGNGLAVVQVFIKLS